LVPIDGHMTWNVYQTGWYGSCERVHVIIKHEHYNTIYALTFLLRWESQSTPVSPNNKTDRQDITEILLNEKVEDTNGVSRSCKSKQDGQCKKCR
jgi:hypothetical protein